MPSLKDAPQPTVSPMLTVKHVAAELACSLSNVYELIGQGKLRAIKIGSTGAAFRIRRADLDLFIDQQSTVQYAEPPSPLKPLPPVHDFITPRGGETQAGPAAKDWIT